MSHSMPLHVEAASTLAVIASSNEPLLFLDGNFRVIAASASFCRSFHVEPENVVGRALFALGDGEWNRPQLQSLLQATASGNALIDAYEMDLVRKGEPPRYLVLHATKLADGDMARVGLLLAITDITSQRSEARQKDSLIREKEILLREVQHRVANSLQIIASVLMQSARKVQSVEAKGHLRDAHHRVMSIAAVQRHLADSQVGSVSLRHYFTQLCDSLGASMISDQRQLSILTHVDDSTVSAHQSVSMGLIVTELVINSLKHGFPHQRHGKIMVDFHSNGEQWALNVTDNGVGMPPEAEKSKPGLGTGIVEALAGQLEATIIIADAKPGVSVTVAHKAESVMLPAA